jgi:PST family polysaccharide transporter
MDRGRSSVAEPQPANSGSSRLPFRDSLTVGVVALVGFSVAQRIVGFGRSVVMTGVLDPVQVGQWDLALGFLMLVPPLVVFGVPGSLGRYFDYFRVRGQLGALLRLTILLSLLAAAGSAALVVAFPDSVAGAVFGARSRGEVSLYLAVALASVVMGNTLVSAILAARMYRAAAALQFAHGLTFSLTSVGLALAWRPTVDSAIVGYAGASLLVGFLAWPMMREVQRNAAAGPVSSHEWTSWRRLAFFAAGIWVTNLLTNVFELADRLLLVHASPMSPDAALAEVGAYHAARLLPLTMVGLTALLASALTPALSAHWEEGRRDEAVSLLNLFVKLLLGAAHAGAVLILIVAPLLFNVVWQDKFPSGLAFVAPMAAFAVWFGTLPVAQSYLWCRERAWLVTLSLVAGVVLNVALSLLLIPRLGVYGVAVATSAANLATLLFVFWVSARLGMSWHRGVWILAFVPISLSFGPWMAGAVFLVLLHQSLRSDLIFTPHERDWIRANIRGVADWRRDGFR